MVNPLVAYNEELIRQLRDKSLLEIEKVSSLSEANTFKKDYLTEKQSIIPQIISWISTLSKREDKAKFGKLVNQWRMILIARLDEIISGFENKHPEIGKSFKCDLQGKRINVSHPHPVKKMIYDIYDFFIEQGYQIYEGSEVDSEVYNFDRLNMPSDHPSRSPVDTFYLKDLPSFLLRTHTSNCQGRVMEMNVDKEIKVVAAGKTYRRDDDDPTHSHQYTNLEVIVIGKSVKLTDLKGTLEKFFQWVFSKDVKVRLRPSFFPFTEPSFEVDCSCMNCNGKGQGCSVCKGTGWIEILGAGLIHPKVLKDSGYNEKLFTGFALGMGVERILMIKHGIDDIRDFYLNDLRFLSQTKWN